jgi:hypothetical protein
MRNHNFLSGEVFKILMIIGFICISNAEIYGQEEMQDAIVTVSFSEKDGSKIITAIALDQEGLPIEYLDLYFYVKRTFSLLPIGDMFNSTDENGVVEVKFPSDLPADEEGNVIIVVKIMEADMYNDLTLEMTKNWGVPVILEDPKVEQRSLWAAAANAPISLVLTVSAMILAIWYIICYIIFNLYLISRIKRLNK